MKTKKYIKAVDVLQKVASCPVCGSETALCMYKSTHLRWCIKCNVSFTIIYNKKLKQPRYVRSPVMTGLRFPDE